MRLAPCLVAAAATIAHADPRASTAEDPDIAMSRAFLKKVNANDMKGARRLVLFPLGVRGMWFESPACRKRFAKIDMIDTKNFSPFFKCLRELALSEHVVMMPDNIAPEGKPWFMQFTAEPGVVHVPVLIDGKVTALLNDALTNTIFGGPDVDAPTPPQAVIESHFAAGDLSTPEAPNGLAEIVTATFCISAEGTTENVILIDVPSPSEHSKRVAANIKTWTFTPFVRKKKPIRVCSRFEHHNTKLGVAKPKGDWPTKKDAPPKKQSGAARISDECRLNPLAKGCS